jgi:hypothetical protein
MSDNNNAGFVLATTGTNTGRFCCIYALAASSVTFTGIGSTPNATALAIPVIGKVCGLFSSVTVNSGSVVIYNA